MRLTGLWAVGVAAMIAGPALAKGIEVPLADDFQGYTMTIDAGGGYDIYAAARAIGGRIAVCGAVIFHPRTPNTTRNVEAKFTETMGFSLAGVPLGVSTRSFARYDDEDAVRAHPYARCSVTETPWQKAFKGKTLTMNSGARSVRE